MGKLGLPGKKVILGALIIALGGMATGYFLLPGDEAAEQMQAVAVSQEVGKATAEPAVNIDELKSTYDAELAAGGATFPTVQAYGQGLQKLDDIEGAVQIWRAYTAAHADDVAGWRERAGFENLAKHEDEYLESLTQVARLDPSEASLKALSDYQNYKQKFAEQKDTLVRLVEMTNKQNGDYLLALADVSLTLEDKETALSALDDYYKNEAFAATRNTAKVESYIRLLAQAGRKDEAVDQAIALTKDAKIAVVMQPQSSEIVLAQNVPMDEDSTAGASIPPLPPVPSMPEAPPLPEAEQSSKDVPVVGQEEQKQQEVVASDNVENVDEESPLPVPPIPPAPLPEPIAGQGEAQEEKPVDQTEAVVESSPAPSGLPVDDAPLSAPLTEEASAVSALPDEVAVQAVPSEVETPLPVETADQPVAQDVQNVTASPEPLAVPQESQDMQPDVALHARLADVLLYEAGADYAVRYIEAVSAHAYGGVAPEAMQPVYARAMVQQGKYDQALPILKALSVQGGEYREWYFLALSAAAKKDAQAKKDLIAFVQENFTVGDLTEDQKIDRVYALLNAGEKSLALDYTERGLQAAPDAVSRDKWQSLHKGLTAKPKAVVGGGGRAAPRISLEQKLQIANRPGVTQDYARRTAFEALAAGKKPEAIVLFARLAAANGPESADAGQLMYLWGARITGEELGWMIDIANQASGDERGGWISKVANAAASEDIVAIAEAYPDWLQHPEFDRRYLGALVQLHATEKLNDYLETQASSHRSLDAYQAVAAQAGSVLDFPTQEQALKKATEIAPNNRDVWLQLTALYLSRARYTAAEHALANAMYIDPATYATDQYAAARQTLSMNYFAGALAKRNGEFTTSNDYYARALSAAGDTMFSDRDSQVKLLSTQMALGNETVASQGFETLLENNPGDATLLADYMSSLLDRGSYLQALDVAGRHGGDVVLDSTVAVDDPDPVYVQSLNGEMPLIQVMSGGSELKLQFSRPLPQNYHVLLNGGNPSWVAYTSTSYDTALIVAQSGYALQATATPEGLLVSAAPTANASSAEAVHQRYLRLQTLYTRLELETGATDKALERLESLAPTYQDYPEYRAYQANAEYFAGNLKRGLNLIKRAQAGDPENEDIAYLRRNIERFHAEHLKLDHEWQKMGDHKMHITTLEARKQYNNAYEVSAQYQNNFIDTDVVRRASGALMPVDGHRWRATLSLARFMDDSSIIEGTIYANKDTPGAGLSYQFVNPIGTTQVYAQYHKPYWDVVEAVVENTTRDRAGLWHLWRPDPRWSVRVDGGYNRYHIDDKTNLADSVGAQATILRTLWDKQPYVALAYGFDTEHFLGGVNRNGVTGDKLLPLRSREVHSLSGIFYHDFTRDTNGEMSVGYAVDRLGGHGPAAEGRLTHFVTDDVDLQVRARYGLETNNTDNDALSVGGYVRWTW